MSQINHLISLTFIYPNRDEIQCGSLSGKSLYEVAIKNGIQMNDKCLGTCVVQIQASTKESRGFHEHVLNSPTDSEIKAFSEAQLRDGFRFANTYFINDRLSNAMVFLNLVRVRYTDLDSKTHVLSAYKNESLLSLRERYQAVVDLSFSCHGALACSTCHCVFDVSDSVFNRLDEISEDEEDLLQFCNPQKHSRLGCQILELPNSFDDILHFRNPRSKPGV